MTFIDAVRVRLLALSVGLLLMVLASAVQSELVVQSWVSSSDMSQRLAAQEPLRFGPGPCSTATVIRVDPGRTFQTILGLGSSLEHSTCYNIARLPKERQAEVMESLVDAEAGIGMSLMRICIGTPDFTASPWYSYDDVPVGQTDPALNAFSIEKDRQYVLPILKLALEKSPELTFFASPWSPPGWMKDNDRLCGGRIDPRHFAALAQYFVRFIKAYEAEGVRIHAVTPQNEPGYFPGSYPTCGWTAAQQRDFIRDHLGPAFQTHDLTTRIWCYDHNFNNLRFPTTILRDDQAGRYVDGTAFHHYEGEPAAMTTLHERFPDKHIYFSEGSVFGIEGAAQLIAFLRNWARCYNAWVTTIDHRGKPNPGPHDCSPTSIVLNSETLELEYRFDYYMYGQFMKFIRPGAVRVHSDTAARSLPNVAVRNADGSVVLVAVNLARTATEFAIEWNGTYLTARLDAHSLATFRWTP